MPTGVYIRSEEHKQKFILSRRGKYTGAEHHLWKGNNVSYKELHNWVKRHLGKATKCINGHVAKRYVWANISGEYKRDLSDWHELCDSCNLTDGIKINERFYA